MDTASKFVLLYAINKVQDTQARLKLNGTYHLLAYFDDVTLLQENTDAIKKNTETLNDAIKVVGVEACRGRYISVSSPEFREKSLHKNFNEVL
jgi:hypothetical protein